MNMQENWEFVRTRVLGEKYVLRAVGIFLVIFLGLVCLKTNDKRHSNNELAYTIRGPGSWRMILPIDRKTVTFSKRGNTERFDNSIIALDVQMGNPYGTTALDYVAHGLVPRVRRIYSEKGVGVDIREEPETVMKKDREWGTVSFFVDYNDVLTYYVTVENDNVYVISLYSRGGQHEKEERLLEHTVDTFVVKRQERKNEFTDR